MKKSSFSLHAIHLTSIFISSFFICFLLGSQVKATDVPITDARVLINYRICGYNSTITKIECSSSYIDQSTENNSHDRLSYDSSTNIFTLNLDDLLSSSNFTFLQAKYAPYFILVEGLSVMPLDLSNNNSNHYLSTEKVINIDISSDHNWFYGSLSTYGVSSQNQYQYYWIRPRSYDYGYSFWRSGSAPTFSSSNFLCYDQPYDTCWLALHSPDGNASLDNLSTSEAHLDMAIDGNGNLFSHFRLLSRPWVSNANGTSGSYTSSPSIIQQIDIDSGLQTNISGKFFIKLWLSDEMPSMNDIAYESDVAYEEQVINNALNSTNSDNNSLMGITFNPFLPFTAFFNGLFNASGNDSCKNFTILPSLFGVQSAYICSPWGSDIRNILTPLFSFASIMLLFGFIIGFFRNSDELGSRFRKGM